VIEPEIEQEPGEVMLDAHGMDPVKVLALAGTLGPVPERIVVVGCEPLVAMSGDEEDLVGELSEPVRAALDDAVELVLSVVGELTETHKGGAR
jgi:Ni,Fe-hydrogenase maturation factor